MATTVSNLKIGYQTGGEGTIYASWTCSAEHIDHYTVKWTYWTGDNVEFVGQTSDTEETNDTYSPPDNAHTVHVYVTPVSTTYTSNGNEKSYWTGTKSLAKLTTTLGTPETPSAPSVTVDQYTLTATLDNISDDYISAIQFYVVKNNTSKLCTGTCTVSYGHASFSCSIGAGNTYTVTCRGYNSSKNLYGEWSEYSDEVSTVPLAPTINVCHAESETSVKVSWDAQATATQYNVEYTTAWNYFGRSPSNVTSVTITEGCIARITGLEGGSKYFFRVNAENENGTSEWSDIRFTVVGTVPSAPTTWSSTTTAILGEDVTLYWTHNSEDGSYMRGATLHLIVNGVSALESLESTTDFPYDEDNEENTGSYVLDMSSYPAGAEVLWRVCTRGVLADYSDWSVQRAVYVYAPPVLSLDAPEQLTTLPLSITATAEGGIQTPTGYQVSIVANTSYETVDATGSTVYVYAGNEVYSKYFASSDSEFSLDISAGDITLENGETYTLTVTVAMDSGLTAEATETFEVSWDDAAYNPDAGIAVDYDTLSCYISPFCYDEDGSLASTVTLSVYRREFDGTLTSLVTGLANTGYSTITDPHPALDYARYRIVAIDGSTGAVSYSDLPGQPIKEPSIVLQWDEDWSSFDYDEASESTEPPWSGSMVKIPYNIDISENHEKDVSLVEYIGRSYPVSYYGTQQGYTASWSCEIPKSDKETIYALRRLSRYNGDVYVREPTGTGYWAQISVSMNINHCELTVPISLELTRVEEAT